MKVFYWSPYLAHVATITAVLNSALSLKKYSKGTIDISIINSSGEWNSHKDKLMNEKINVIDIFKKEFFKSLPRYGFLKSRFSYIKIFLLSFFFLKKNDPKRVSKFFDHSFDHFFTYYTQFLI